MTDNLRREREAATRLQERYREDLQRLREDKDLSVDGRQRRIAQLQATTKAKLAKHQRADCELLANRYKDLEDKLYVAHKPFSQDAATFAISVRDASDRAAQLRTADDAQQLFSRALASGDDVLARAVVQHSMGQSYAAATPASAAKWESVLTSFLEANSYLQPVVEELGEIEGLTNKSEIFSPFVCLLRAMSRRACSTPLMQEPRRASVPEVTGRTSDTSSSQSYGFSGWSPEAEAEADAYTVAAVNAGLGQPARGEQRHRKEPAT
jgi:hypothetical protein